MKYILIILTGLTVIGVMLYQVVGVERSIQGSERTQTHTRADFNPDNVTFAVNTERLIHGFSELEVSEDFNKLASKRVKSVCEGQFNHDGFVELAQDSVSYRTISELLARDYPNPQRTAQGWLQSPDHREAMLRSTYNKIGVANMDDCVVMVLGR